jgi:aryl-alcohol dehydrogenase-like predicted oxidoreductase
VTDRPLGDHAVSPIALGTATLGFRGPESEADGVAAIRVAVDAGITLLDTALAYTRVGEPSQGERLVREALRDHPDRERVVVATKGGHRRTGETTWSKDGRPEALRRDCETSLRWLGTDSLDLYQLHWPDPDVPFDESVGALEDLRREGLVRRIGLSNVTAEQLDVARTITTVTSMQNPLSPYDLTDLPMARLCGRLGIAYLAYSPLGSGGRAQELAQAQPAFAAVARSRGVTPQQVALAWLLALAPTVIPVVGATRAATIRSSAAAAAVVLSAEEQELLTRAAGEGG